MVNYLKSFNFQSKLLNYSNSTDTISIDLPTALLIAYYDQNPQSAINASTIISTQNLLNSYYTNQPILANTPPPKINNPLTLNINNVYQN